MSKYKYKVTHRSGKEEIIDSLNAWANTNLFTASSVQLCMKQGRDYAGYRFEKLAGETTRGMKYVVIGPDDKDVEITNIASFCREKRLIYANFLGFLKGRIPSFNGYKIKPSVTKDENLFVAVRENGDTIRFSDINQFCHERKLSARHVKRVIAGKQKSHRTYRFARAG